MSSMISYFNDRVLTPEMMRAMIILYIGPHNRPDFSTDYLLSPVLAPESLLTRFPKTIFCTGERDPLVDDTVIFAGRMRRAKRDQYMRERYSRAVDTDDDDNEFDEMDVTEVVLLPGVSHGFLQFPTVYPPAWKLFTRCAGWINNLFRDAEMRATEAERNMLRERERKLRERERMRAAESSEDERPLEIAMTKMKSKRNVGVGSATGGGEKTMNGVNGLGSGDEAKSRRNGRDGRDEELESTGKKERRKMRVAHTGQDLKTLKSSEDLLGRRMHGLAGGLTGLTEDD